MQVLEWAQRILAAGEAFSGLECSSLRSTLTAQSSNFFTAYHSSNLEALHSMLDKELWRRLPSISEGAPPLLVSFSLLLSCVSKGVASSSLQCSVLLSS